jgi:hypothetical protein
MKIDRMESGLTWNREVILSHAGQTGEGTTSLIPPQEAIPNILCVSGKVAIKLVMEVQGNWGKVR